MKTCTKCMQEKDESEFYRKTPTRLRAICKVCENKRNSQYCKDNPEQSRESCKRYRQKNLEKELARCNQYKARNKAHLNKKACRYYRNRRKYDLLFAVKSKVRGRVGSVLRKAFGVSKSKSTNKILGCTGTELLVHLNLTNIEQLKNCHLDHVAPISLALTEDEVYKLNHYSNLRIIPAAENLSKSDSWTPEGAMMCLILLGREWVNPALDTP